MTRWLYPRLAADGMRKNRQLCLPYLLTCIGMVLMVYIMLYLKLSPVIAGIRGGETLQNLMETGVVVTLFFAALFLLYTNSFLLRRRKKEFGLYNILGMGKGNLSRILVWETLFTAVISISAGLAGGIALSKLAELGLLALTENERSYTLSVSLESVWFTAQAFAVIFLLLLLKALWETWRGSAVTLLRSENEGEKPPKANWVLGLLGIALLGIAYYLAATIETPLKAMMTFSAAVLLVIAGTYLVMIAGSVLLCRVLQKNRRYYYKPNHFVSVSSMAYRMRRNGAGLASICILVTMVLVMLSSTAALVCGSDEIILSRYPREVNLWFSGYEDYGNRALTEEERTLLADTVTETLAEYGAEQTNLLSYRTAEVSGLLTEGGEFLCNEDGLSLSVSEAFESYVAYLVPLEDYNAVMGTDAALAEDEVLVYAVKGDFSSETLSFSGGREYRVKELLTDCFVTPDMASFILPSLLVVFPDAEAAAAELTDADGDSLVYWKWQYFFDTGLSSEENDTLAEALNAALRELPSQESGFDAFLSTVESRDTARADFFAVYGGLFYLGILLSIVFLFAAVLLLYYKQLSEGYEDQARFSILRKVGMTKEAIRKTVNSQLLTVFFLPLLGAGIHLVFAFPILEKLLQLFNFQNRTLFFGIAAGCFAVFALFYALVYRVTSNAYYRIVSGAEDA